MIVRKIRKDEYKRCGELCAAAFEFPLECDDKTSEALVDEIIAAPSCRQDIYWDSRWSAFEDDDVTMMSNMTVIPYQARFDGHIVPMAGIGGVVTLPQYRRHGCIRSVFEQMLPAEYESGTVLSYLHPFSTAFYRKFGYELACVQAKWKVQLQSLPKLQVEGRWVLLEKGTNLAEDMKQVDDDFGRKYNCMIVNEEIEYAWMKRIDPFRDRQYTYLYYGKDGRPEGYVTYRPDADKLECKRLAFRSFEGLKGIMALLQSNASRHSHATFKLPEDIELAGIFPEYSFEYMQCRRHWNGMARVVNAEAVLKLAKSRGEGTLVVEISDSIIAQNNGRFRVQYAPGQKNQVQRTDAEPDISLTIQDFTRLILGRNDIRDAEMLPTIRLNCSIEKAEGLFYRKPLYLCHHF